MNQKQQSMARFKDQGAAVRETLSGYAQAAAFVERERMGRLARMTPEEARAIYDDLCRSWATWGRNRDLERLEQWRLETLLAVREAEDLIIHKAVAGRPQDLRDIEGVVYRQGSTLDAATIRRWLGAFAAVLEQPDLLERFETPWRKMLEFRSQGE